MPRKYTTEDFVKKAHEVHGDTYNYSKVDYLRSTSKVIIGCSIHGDFEQQPQNHVQGQGCPVCGGSMRKTKDSIIAEFKKLHGDKYDYSIVQYINDDTPINVICNKHGEFSITPNSHKRGSGCKACGYQKNSERNRLDLSVFVDMAKSIHGDHYDYSKVEYKNQRCSINIGCPKHGWFEQVAGDHLSGSGCPKCTGRVSKSSQRWLDSLDVKDREVYGLVDKYIVDGFDPITKTVYEYHGDYWHGNPDKYDSDDINPTNGKTYGELYERTLEKRSAFEHAGFKYVEIWESEWLTNPQE